MTQRRIVDNQADQKVAAVVKRPWWLMANSPSQSYLVLASMVCLLASVLLREGPYLMWDYIFGALALALIACGVATIVAFRRHPEWNESTFAPKSLTPQQLRVYSWAVGLVGLAGIVCVVMAFVLSVWSLCAIALILFLVAIWLGSALTRRASPR